MKQKIQLTTLPDSKFKESLPNWLEENQSKYDLIFCQGDNRLFNFFRKNQVMPQQDYYACLNINSLRLE